MKSMNAPIRIPEREMPHAVRVERRRRYEQAVCRALLQARAHEGAHSNHHGEWALVIYGVRYSLPLADATLLRLARRAGREVERVTWK